MSYTKGKWELLTDCNGWIAFESAKTGKAIMRFDEPDYKSDGQTTPTIADAKRICHCVNLHDELVEALENLLDCHLDIDRATVPKGGIDIAPQQVVFNASISYDRVQRAKNAVAKAKGTK